MNRVSKWVVALSSVAIGAAALAADPAPQPKPAPEPQTAPQKTDTPATAPASTRRPRLVLPWSQLTDLTDDQKTKILDIIGKTNEEIAAVRSKERTDIMALLNEDQKKKAEEIDASRTRRRGRGAASRPAAGQ
jgi:Spy/CpxP family protein refolding chaperone